MFHPRRTKCCTGTEDREVPSPEAGLEKSCTWGQLNPGRVGFTEAETGKSIPDSDLSRDKACPGREDSCGLSSGSRSRGVGG